MTNDQIENIKAADVIFVNGGEPRIIYGAERLKAQVKKKLTLPAKIVFVDAKDEAEVLKIKGKSN